MLCLWLERNARCFEGSEWSIVEIKIFFFHTLLYWNVAFQPLHCSSLLDLLEHCNLSD